MLALGAGGCTDVEWEAGEPTVVPGTEEERRIMEREERADAAGATMLLVLFLVGPMGIAAVALAVSHRNDR